MNMFNDVKIYRNGFVAFGAYTKCVVQNHIKEKSELAEIEIVLEPGCPTVSWVVIVRVSDVSFAAPFQNMKLQIQWQLQMATFCVYSIYWRALSVSLFVSLNVWKGLHRQNLFVGFVFLSNVVSADRHL